MSNKFVRARVRPNENRWEYPRAENQKSCGGTAVAGGEETDIRKLPRKRRGVSLPPPLRHAVSRRIVFVSKFRGAVDSSRGGSIMHDFCHRVGKNRTSVARARASSEIRVSRGVTTRCRVSGSFLEINYLCITINYDTAERAFLQSARNGRAAATATRENLQNTPRLFYLPTPL